MNDSVKKVTIQEILSNADTFTWSDSLFLSIDDVWVLETEGLVWDPDDVESDEDEVPKSAEENGYDCFLSIQTIQSIVRNAKQQRPDASLKLLLDAFLYYWDNDAFITF